ncbi:unnamed protein product, partial [marine sediment metagenome]
ETHMELAEWILEAEKVVHVARTLYVNNDADTARDELKNLARKILAAFPDAEVTDP